MDTGPQVYNSDLVSVAKVLVDLGVLGDLGRFLDAL